MKYMISCFLLLHLLSLSAFAVEEDLLATLVKQQKGMRTIVADFSQEKKSELFGRTMRSSGTFYLQRGVGVRWQYSDGLVVIYDGSTLYLYNFEMDEAQKIDGAAGYAGPLNFDLKTLDEAFEIASDKVSGIVTLKLIPRKPMSFTSMQMMFSEKALFPSQVVVHEEESGDLTTIRFDNIRKNTNIDPAMFVFSPPSGTKIIERRIQSK